MNKITKLLPEDEQPYEKVKKYGVSSLTDAELLAIFVRSGTTGINCVELSKKILEISGKRGLVGLNYLNFNDYKKIKGIGEVKAIQLMCISELSMRIAKENAKNSLNFSCSSSVANYYMEQMRHSDREILKLVMLDTKNNFIADEMMSTGCSDASIFSVRDILRFSISHNAAGIILLHNHPSGDPTPSMEDIASTRKLIEASKIIGINVLDHIVIGDNRYVSIYEYIRN